MPCARRAGGKDTRMQKTARAKNWCYPRVPRAEKGRPNGCWYKAALNRLGYYTPPARGITDDLDDPEFRAALHAFQRQATVQFGDTEIGPGTTTERVLMEALEETDESAAYIWRTAADDKVRDEHASRAGKTYTWDAPPDGDHPGDDYNCRCWAEPLNPSQHPWAVWAREQREERREKTAQSLAAPIGLKDDITDLQTSLPLDAINPTWSPFDFMALGTAATSRTVIQKLIPLATRDTSWRLGNYKSQARWKSQMRDRNWTKEKIDETLKKGKRFPALNNINKGNNALRYEYKGTYLVRDEKTKEIIHLGSEKFIRPPMK